MNARTEWNECGMSITSMFDPLIEFLVRDIDQKFYQSRRLNIVLSMIVDQAWKILMKDHEYDITRLQKFQLEFFFSLIRKMKDLMCKFGSLIFLIFFYS